jgi:glutathione peroxidase
MKAWVAAIAVGVACALGAAGGVAMANEAASRSGVTEAPRGGLLGHEFRRLASPERVNLADAFGGKVLLIVNTASKCGLTPQYEGLEALNARFGAQGFAVLGFPSDDFLGQEFDDEGEIAEFCTLNYGVRFPMFEKVDVRGREAIPLFRQLAEATGDAPDWNFHKYLVGRDGRAIASFGSRIKPEAAEIVAAIEQALAAPKPAG